MLHRLGAVASAGLLSLVIGGTTSAHLGAAAAIAIGADHVLPGSQFSVSVSDVSANALIEFTLRQQGSDVVIGSATAGPDGHFETTLAMPADAAHGYAELIASSRDGTAVSTWVLIGPQTGAIGPSPATSSPPGLDPSLLVLLAVVCGAFAAVGYVLLRPKTRPSP